MSISGSLLCSISLWDIYVPITHCLNYFGFIIVLDIFYGTSPNIVHQNHYNNYLQSSIPSECQDYFDMSHRKPIGNVHTMPSHTLEHELSGYFCCD